MDSKSSEKDQEIIKLIEDLQKLLKEFHMIFIVEIQIKMMDIGENFQKLGANLCKYQHKKKIIFSLKANLNNNKMQITSYEDLTADKIIFKEAKEYKVKDPKIKYKRIPIETLYPSGKKGALVIESPFLFS